MARARNPSAAARRPEREFYLREFRGRTLAIACPAAALRSRSLRGALETLRQNTTRVLLLSEDAAGLTRVTGSTPFPYEARAPHLAAQVWRRARRGGLVGVHCRSSAAFASLASALGVFKLVWIDPGGGLRSGRRRLSFVHQGELRGLARKGGRRAPLLRSIDAALRGGVQSVNLCSADGLRKELLTYEGSGTLFTRERYVDVRRLRLDDFDAASSLIARGVRDGALARRRRPELDRVLGAGFGAFVEGRDLAGVASLLSYPPEDGGPPATGEIACLYTLTRFLGEGVGVELVDHLLREAEQSGLEAVFACTALDAAARFFARRGFTRVARSRAPLAKWDGYDPRRLQRVRVYWRAL